MGLLIWRGQVFPSEYSFAFLELSASLECHVAFQVIEHESRKPSRDISSSPLATFSIQAVKLLERPQAYESSVASLEEGDLHPEQKSQTHGLWPDMEKLQFLYTSLDISFWPCHAPSNSINMYPVQDDGCLISWLVRNDKCFKGLSGFSIGNYMKLCLLQINFIVHDLLKHVERIYKSYLQSSAVELFIIR